MTLEQFQRYQEETFDSFCKAIIRNESANAHNEIAARAEKEISFSSLSDSDLQSFNTVDVYHPYCKKYHVRGNVVCVYDPTLGEILQHISPQRREIILLCYFLGFSDSEIGRLLHIDHRTVDYRRNAALRRLRELLEEMDNA